LPVSGFCSDRALLRERADIGCVLITNAVDSDGILLSAGEAAGVDLPLVSGMTHTGPRRVAIWLTPRSWLLLCDIEEESPLVARLNGTFPEKPVHAVSYTDCLCWFELSGTASLDLLTEGSFLSLESGGLPIAHAKRTLIAQIAAVVVRESELVWSVAVERSRARYFVDWLIAAAATGD
jgi:heterotetrameric sarcosine oxidase gamma subunit